MRKKFFDKIDFNKRWDENDWERYFQAQDDYRVSTHMSEIRKKPFARLQFEGPDEVAAFDPIFREYGSDVIPAVFHQLKGVPFSGDSNPEDEYQPTAEEDPHYWREGSPLASCLIYRDACRFAICASQELTRYAKRRDPAYRKETSSTFESLRFHANWVAVNIGQGHRIGYSEDRIRGNIAKCLRALRHAETCIRLLGKISTKTRSSRLRKDLFAFAVQLRNALYYWIDEIKMRAG